MDKEKLRSHFERDGGEKTYGVDFDRFYEMMTAMAKEEAATVTQRICTSGMFDTMRKHWPKHPPKFPPAKIGKITD